MIYMPCWVCPWVKANFLKLEFLKPEMYKMVLINYINHCLNTPGRISWFYINLYLNDNLF